MNYHFIRDYIMDYKTMLGYAGSVGYFLMEHYEQFAGMVLTAGMLLSSIVLQVYKIKSVAREEHRKEELHRLQIQQQELNNKKLKNNKDGNTE